MRVRAAASFLVLAVALAAGVSAQPRDSGQKGQEQAVAEVLSLMQQSMKLQGEKRAAEAVPLMERAVALCEKELGDSFPLALSLEILAGLRRELNDLDRAEPLFARALAVRERVQGSEHADVASTLGSLASIANTRQDYARAEQLYLRALAIAEKARGPEDASVAVILFGLSHTYLNRGLHARAEPLLRRALSIQEKALGPAHPFVAGTLNNLAFLLSEKGDYAQAAALFERSIAVFEKAFGPESLQVATPVNSLASLYRQTGDYVRAERLFKRALAIVEKTAGPESEDYSITLNSLALLYSDKGDDESALPLLRRALAIREKVLGPEHSSVAASLSSIAYIHNERREYAQAVELYERALRIVEKTLGPETPLYASTLNNLAITCIAAGDAARGEGLARRALELREKVLGPEHPDVAVSLNTVAYLSFIKGEFVKEEPLYLRALRIAEKSLGPDHPTVGTYLANLSTVYWGRGDTRRALEHLTRASELRERNLALVLSTGAEEQKRRYMATLADETDANVSFHVRAAPADRDAAALALLTVLRRKGRVLDALTDQIETLRRHLNPQDRALLERLSAARSALARLVLDGAGGADASAERARLQTEVERLEAEVSERAGAELRAQAQPVTLEAVRRAVPPGAALVELVLYRPYDPQGAPQKRFGAARYVAYVLRGEGDEPRWVELGEAAAIDREAAALRAALTDPRRADVSDRARALDELLMRPVRRLLGETRRVFLSPDGALNLVPFGALVDEHRRFLVEDYSITYLTSGRDLLRLQARAESRGGPVVIADPQFDRADGPSAGGETPRGGDGDAPARRSASLAGASFASLPGTREEASALGAILPGARVFTEARATESVLKSLSAPSVLHVATHGFFLPDEGRAGAGGASETQTRGLTLARPKVEGENPLLRSGLALAGANRREGGAGEDGILTALEAAGLDLWGTRLVVLSACETGVGDVRNGDGVYGLRRALVLAGAESQVMSLWQVDDAATRDLMVAYYRRLQAGEGRTEALRAVQLEMLRGRMPRTHPFFWASFIQSGDWKPVK